MKEGAYRTILEKTLKNNNCRRKSVEEGFEFWINNTTNKMFVVGDLVDNVKTFNDTIKKAGLTTFIK